MSNGGIRKRPGIIVIAIGFGAEKDHVHSDTAIPSNPVGLEVEVVMIEWVPEAHSAITHSVATCYVPSKFSVS